MLEVFKCNLWNREMEGDVELRKYYIIQASICFFFFNYLFNRVFQ